MINILYTEILKFKKSKILWLIPIGGILPSLLDFIISIDMVSNGEYLDWTKYLISNYVFMGFIMGVVLFSLISGYVFAREYGEKTINSLFTYPIKKYKFIYAKLIVILFIILTTFTINTIFLMILGHIIIKDSLTLDLIRIIIKNQFIMCIMFWLLTPTTALLGVFSKNVISPIALGMFALLINIVVCNSKYIDVFPWSIPAALVLNGEGHIPNYSKSLPVIAITFIISLGILIIYTKKSDVHSGS